MAASILLLVLIAPLLAAIVVFAAPVRGSQRLIENVHLISNSWVLLGALIIAGDVIVWRPVRLAGGWLYVDALAGIFVMLIGIVGFLTGFYSIGYIRHELETGALDQGKLKTYYGFFSLFLFTMLLAVTANNIVVMWAAIEATTLGSAFLVGLYGHRAALEAAWKYVVICTVGVAFGLYGTVLLYANASAIVAPSEDAALWTTLVAHASRLDPVLVKLAFVFALVGFGTKAGLFPMHAWLPDAHSEAPSPVSALLSGVLLKCALFAIIRNYIIAVHAVGSDFPRLLVLILGSLSIAVASFLFFVQKDLKRKLAYSSVENVGLMALALGFGGPIGVSAALLHAVNHSFAKALMFCGAGNVLMKYGTRDLRAVKGVLRAAPASGLLLMAGCLALAGFPPFNIFVSEFLVFTAGLKAGYIVLMIVCALILTVTVAGFVQIVSGSVLGARPEALTKGDVGWLSLAPTAILLALVVMMGVAVPGPLSRMILQATAIVLDEGTAIPASAPFRVPSARPIFADADRQNSSHEGTASAHAETGR